jgi:hypothetical protein
VARQQFNVNLDPELVRSVKHHAIDVQLSLSDLVSAVLTDYLTREATMSGSLQLQPMVHVEALGPALDFYTALGAELVHGSRDGDFALIRFGTTELSLLAHPPNPAQDEGTVELNFEARTDLSQLEVQLIATGVRIVVPTTDEGFGRQLQVQSPDGLLIKINELDPSLYT